MNALVLSAGGMYGAYQAGAWKAISDTFSPDLIVGASIGAVNGWAIAGGCDPGQLIHRWLNLDCAARYAWKLPRALSHGLLDTESLQRSIRDIYESFRPQIPFAVVATDLRSLRPRIFRDGEVTWEHLVASTAILGLFDQVGIAGRIYSDGGLLSAVPLWAAAELGATSAVVLDALPEAPGRLVKTVVSVIRSISPFRPVTPPAMTTVRIAPHGLLRPPLSSLCWNRENIQNWIRAGERDALAVKHSLSNCFERK